MTADPRYKIASKQALREIYPTPSAMVQNKTLDHIDVHGRNLIAHAPLALVSTVDGRGRVDVSPKGDAPGFVNVLSDRQLALPDRLGNKLLEGYENLLETGRVGLLFLIPGLREVYRVNGSAWISNEPALLEQLAAQGKPALTAMIVEVEEAFIHCGKAMIRSNLWNADKYPDLTALPSSGKMIADHINANVREVEEDLADTYQNRLY